MILLEHNYLVDIFHLNFSKAFNKIPRQRLLKKLEVYGIIHQILKFISAFLEDCKLYVSVNGCKKKERVVKYGVPQRFIMAPLLFAIYINDPPDEILNATKLFVNELKLIANAKGHRSIEKDLKTFEKWRKNWLLPFNIAN